MMESDDVEEFLRQPEVALKSSNFPRDKWKHNLLTQMTVNAKEPVVEMLDDKMVG